MNREERIPTNYLAPPRAKAPFEGGEGGAGGDLGPKQHPLRRQGPLSLEEEFCCSDGSSFGDPDSVAGFSDGDAARKNPVNTKLANPIVLTTNGRGRGGTKFRTSRDGELTLLLLVVVVVVVVLLL
jgi:hypothetical protein